MSHSLLRMFFLPSVVRLLTALHLFSVNKQINDKERTAAAMENPTIRNVVERCIKDPD